MPLSRPKYRTSAAGGERQQIFKSKSVGFKQNPGNRNQKRKNLQRQGKSCACTGYHRKVSPRTLPRGSAGTYELLLVRGTGGGRQRDKGCEVCGSRGGLLRRCFPTEVQGAGEGDWLAVGG